MAINSDMSTSVAAAPVVQISTSLGETCVGSVFANDTNVSNCVVLHCAGDASTHHDDSIRTIRIVSERFITSAAVVTPDNAANRAPTVDLNAPLVPLSVDKLREREAKQLARLKKAAQQLNAHATPQAQALFNSLAKTMPCRWSDNNSIVVFEGKFTVRVSDPYTDASVVGTDEPSVARVKLVLNGEKAKMKN